MKFLIFGDVVGRPGRLAVSKMLPQLREQYQPDSVIINVENIASTGMGISPKGFEEARKWRADVYTTGDHAWDNQKGVALMEKTENKIIRPANYPAGAPGRGYIIFNIGVYQVAVINLQGQVFFKNHPLNPFHILDELLQRPDIKAAHIKLVDFQAEASSEKRGLGWYVDGKISALWGTHTHVPTADAQILPGGTGYITDIGMNGNYRSIIGVDPRGPIQRFLTQVKGKMTVAETGALEVGALFLEIVPKTGQTTGIAQIREIVEDEINGQQTEIN